jgi:hypothetical protein
MNCFKHISIEDVYQRMLHELSKMEDRFYKDFDARNLGRSPTEQYWTEFAVPGKY